MTLTSGEEERGNDFANFRQAAKSGVKYNDLDADGTQGVGDLGLSGWTIAAFADVTTRARFRPVTRWPAAR